MRKVLALLSCIVILAGLCLPAGASETILDITYVPIVGNGFVADTFNGVEARYNETGEPIYCVELVIRYYKEVYGIDIGCADGNITVRNNDNYYFERTDTPKAGDIMYGSAAARGKDYSHWSIVKSFNGDSVTCFEENWSWNGQAGVNRRIPYPTGCYEFYTLKAKTGEPVVVNGSDETASAWAEDYITRAAENGISDLTGFYQEPVTRDTFCRMAVNVAASYGYTADSDASACATAVQLGLVSSADGADTPVSREEAAVILVRLLNLIGKAPSADSSVIAAYTDSDRISFWAADSVASMTACGLMSGTGTGAVFQPKALLTNEQAVALLVRVNDNPAPAVFQQEKEASLSAELTSSGVRLISADAAVAGFATDTAAVDPAVRELLERLNLLDISSY